MKAIVDCNSFYCSCERVFRPDLENRPVAVLSNNDGCSIAMTREVKDLGISMATPYFKSKEIIEKNGVAVFSSNYNLYGDMSKRVMQTLHALMGAAKVEVYSVDEAFIDMSHIALEALYDVAKQIKDTVEQWTGVKVSIGVGKTKVLSKVANRLSKKEKSSEGIMVLHDEASTIKALDRTDVADVWGVGRKYAQKLKEEWNIYTAHELSLQKEEWARKYLGGVVGVRLVKELKGEPSITMKDSLENKQMIATTRMFGYTVKDLKDIKEAVATYTARAAEKLRRQRSAANVISVFVVPKEERKEGKFRHGPTVSSYQTLPYPTSITNELIKPALQLVERLYDEKETYKKAGVILSGLVPDEQVQANLFEQSKNDSRWLMEMLDNINFSMRDDIIKYAASGTDRNWKMQRNFHSPRYTTRWNELREVK